MTATAEISEDRAQRQMSAVADRRRGSARIQPGDVDMIWKYRSKVNPQTCLLHAGKPAFRPWHLLVGTTSDGKVAEVGGVGRTAVRCYREKMGIPPYQTRQSVVPRPGIRPREWHKFLGTMPDRAVAQIAGMSFSYVSAARNKLGIPVWSATGAESHLVEGSL